MLRCAGDEAHVSNTGLARFPLRGGNGFRVGIDPVNTCGERRDAERQAAVAAPEVQHALPAHEGPAAPLPELLVRMRPESRRQRGDMSANVADRVRCDPAQKYVQLKPGRARFELSPVAAQNPDSLTRPGRSRGRKGWLSRRPHSAGAKRVVNRCDEPITWSVRRAAHHRAAHYFGNSFS